MTALRYLVWSWEHMMWWGPNRCGYTPITSEAGRYSAAEAGDITVGHIPPGEEVAVDEVWAMRRGRPPRYGADVGDGAACGYGDYESHTEAYHAVMEGHERAAEQRAGAAKAEVDS